MSKVIVPLYLNNLTAVPAPSAVQAGAKLLYMRLDWLKLYNGLKETDLVLDRPLDNYVSKPGFVTDKDTVISAIEKLQYQVIVGTGIIDQNNLLPVIPAVRFDLLEGSTTSYTELVSSWLLTQTITVTEKEVPYFTFTVIYNNDLTNINNLKIIYLWGEGKGSFTAPPLTYLRLMSVTILNEKPQNVYDATTLIKGIVKLAGDLAGTADLPTVPGLLTKENLINKVSVISGSSIDKYPNEKALVDYVAPLVSDIQTQIDDIEVNIDTIETDIVLIKADIVDIETDITTIQQDITNINSDITTIEGDITTIKSDITTINSDITAIEGDITAIEGNITTIEGDITALEVDVATKTEWKGAWRQQQYILNDQVVDEGYLAIANKTTIERPAPQKVGEPFFIYNGTIGSTTAVAKQIIFGNKYTFTQNVFFEGWRINVVAGNRYTVYLVRDPDGLNIVSQIIQFVAQTSGWINLSAQSLLIKIGNTYAVIATVSEPEAVPVTFNGNWNYTQPQNPTIPANGGITQPKGTPSLMYVSNLDNGAVDRSLDLSSLNIGDTIQTTTNLWAIQSKSAQTGYFIFGVSPALLNLNLGIQNFVFEIKDTATLTYPLDPNYWGLNPSPIAAVHGLLGIDIPYQAIVPDNTAYGIGVLLQTLVTSVDWDIQAFSGIGSGGGSAEPLPIGMLKTFDGLALDDNLKIITDNTDVPSTLRLSTNATTAFLGNESQENTAFGLEALISVTTGEENTAFGFGALMSTTGGGPNIGSYNTAVGWGALMMNTTGQQNTAMGDGASQANTSAKYNVAIGVGALAANQFGEQHVAIGAYALNKNIGTSGSNVNGHRSVAIGSSAMLNNTTGNGIAMGDHVLFNQTTGKDNICIGNQAGSGITIGNGNVILAGTGFVVLGGGITTGSNNMILAPANGNTTGITTGSGNVVVGKVAGLPAAATNTITFSDGAGNIRQTYDSAGQLKIITAPVAGAGTVAEQMIVRTISDGSIKVIPIPAGGGGATTLDGLNDVTVASPTEGQLLIYEASSSQWKNKAGTGGGATILDQLTDVTILTPADTEVLTYETSTLQWKNKPNTKYWTLTGTEIKNNNGGIVVIDTSYDPANGVVFKTDTFTTYDAFAGVAITKGGSVYAGNYIYAGNFVLRSNVGQLTNMEGNIWLRPSYATTGQNRWEANSRWDYLSDFTSTYIPLSLVHKGYVDFRTTFTKTFYIDSVAGNNATGAIGDATKPYLNVAGALASLTGNYLETYTFKFVNNGTHVIPVLPQRNLIFEAGLQGSVSNIILNFTAAIVAGVTGHIVDQTTTRAFKHTYRNLTLYSTENTDLARYEGAAGELEFDNVTINFASSTNFTGLFANIHYYGTIYECYVYKFNNAIFGWQNYVLSGSSISIKNIIVSAANTNLLWATNLNTVFNIYNITGTGNIGLIKGWFNDATDGTQINLYNINNIGTCYLAYENISDKVIFNFIDCRFGASTIVNWGEQTGIITGTVDPANTSQISGGFERGRPGIVKDFYGRIGNLQRFATSSPLIFVDSNIIVDSNLIHTNTTYPVDPNVIKFIGSNTFLQTTPGALITGSVAITIEQRGSYALDGNYTSIGPSVTINKTINNIPISTIITADNGLTKTIDNIQLGGPINKTTFIDGDAGNAFVFALGGNTPIKQIALAGGNATATNYSFVTLNSTNGILKYVSSGSDAASLYLDSAGVTLSGIGGGLNARLTIGRDTLGSTVFEDNRTGVNRSGIEYFADYSANFRPLSLINKAYADSHYSGVIPVFTQTVNGLVPAPINVGGTFLSDTGQWIIPSATGAQSFMLTNTASDIAPNKKMVRLEEYVQAAQGSTSVTLTPTAVLMGTFITEPNFPNLNKLNIGTAFCNFVTQKSGGGSGYYCYFTLTRRTAAGTETLLLTSANTSTSLLNTPIQQIAFLQNPDFVALSPTDRMIVKIYGVMVSGGNTAVALQYDGSTNARFQSPYANNAIYELLINKQNDLTPDPTGDKYPTVEAVRAGIAAGGGSGGPGSLKTEDNLPIDYEGKFISDNTGVRSVLHIGTVDVYASGPVADLSNTAFGYNAMIHPGLTAGAFNNCAYGYACMPDLQGSASNNTGIGGIALLGITTGNRNTAVGGSALLNITTANDNTAVGFNTLGGNGSFNIALGSQAGKNTSSSNNILIQNVLDSGDGGVTTGNFNIIIDARDSPGVTTGSNNVIIGGFNTVGNVSDSIYLGTGNGTQRMVIDSTGQVRISFTPNSAAGTEQMLVRDSATGFIKQMAIPSGNYTIVTATSNFALTQTVGEVLVKCNSTTAAFTLTLPTAIGNRARFHFKKTAGPNPITIDPFGTQTIDDSLTIAINTMYTSITLISDDANWLII